MDLLCSRDLVEVLELPSPERNFDRGVHYISPETVVKCIELRTSRINISQIFRSGEKQLNILEIARRLKLSEQICNEIEKIYTPTKMLSRDDELYAPLYLDPSRILQQKKLRKLTRGDITLPAGSHLVATDALTEAGIHEYLSSLNCPSIVELKNMFFTAGTLYKRPRLYLHLERCDNSLKSVSESLSHVEMLSVIFQVLFTLAFMHSHGVYHNDMHLKNILLVRCEHLKVNNTELMSVSHLTYKIQRDGKEFIWNIPRERYFVKIADFGIASKWSLPILLSSDCATAGIDGSVPNFPSPAYDPLCFLRSVMMHSSEHASLACAILSDVMNKPRGESPAKFFGRYFSDNDRPYMSTLSSMGDISPVDVLQTRAFSQFLSERESVSAVNMGTIEDSSR